MSVLFYYFNFTTTNIFFSIHTFFLSMFCLIIPWSKLPGIMFLPFSILFHQSYHLLHYHLSFIMQEPRNAHCFICAMNSIEHNSLRLLILMFSFFSKTTILQPLPHIFTADWLIHYLHIGWQTILDHWSSRIASHLGTTLRKCPLKYQTRTLVSTSLHEEWK